MVFKNNNNSKLLANQGLLQPEKKVKYLGAATKLREWEKRVENASPGPLPGDLRQER